jgi:GntR family transcriptional regulator, rspAB operon transcriptional repressor
MTPYENIKEEIILGKLKPGEFFNEKEYAEKLHVSRTPIREAILKLNDEGYIQILPRKGTMIRPISYSDILYLYEYRLLIEPNLLNLIRKEIDSEWIDRWMNYFKSEKTNPSHSMESCLEEDMDKKFHLELVSFTNNPYLIKEEERLMDQCLRVRILSNMESEERYLSSIDEHMELLDAISKNDSESYNSLMTKHLKNTLKGFTFLGD